jgi:hypothetical protein
MSTEPVRMERRAGQRFEVNLPISIRVAGQTIPGFTQNVSARGVFLYMDASLAEGTAVALTFTMPSEITLAESMPVRCLGRVLRGMTSGAGQRCGIAVQLDSYQYLQESEPALQLARVSPAASGRESPGTIPRG